MKKIFLLLVTAIQLTAVYSQSINYQKSFSDAKVKAEKEKKVIFILLYAPTNHTPNFTSGIDAKEVVEFYNKNFISYRASIADSAASNAIRKIINPTIYPAYIFLDRKAQLVYKAAENFQQPGKYLDMAQEALNRIASGKTMSHFEELEKSGKITADQLKQYITFRQGLELFDNAKLIDEYVDLLTVKSFDDYNEVLFILKAAPYINSKAYKLAYTNRIITDSIYKHEPLAIRVAINNHIAVNTRNEAIRTKNVGLAQAVANEQRSSWGKNYREGAKIGMYDMLIYYRAVKDTNNYFWQASNYYDSYYLNISADSAKKLQQIALDKLKETISKNHKAENVPVKSVRKNDTVRYSAQFMVVGGPSNSVATALNNAAWDFYAMGTHNTTHLIKALTWCRRSIELQPGFTNYDTMAHIMYRLNFYDEAQLNQQKAIEMATNQSVPAQEIDKLKAELIKMKEHIL